MIKTSSNQVFPVPGTNGRFFHIHSWVELNIRSHLYIYFVDRRTGRRYIEELIQDGTNLKFTKILDENLWMELNERVMGLGLHNIIVPPEGTEVTEPELGKSGIDVLRNRGDLEDLDAGK